MPAKQTWIVEMPEGWVPAMCPDCHIQYSGATGICGESKCPLTNAKKAVYSGYADSLGAHMIATPKGKAITLWATELEEKK